MLVVLLCDAWLRVFAIRSKCCTKIDWAGDNYSLFDAGSERVAVRVETVFVTSQGELNGNINSGFMVLDCSAVKSNKKMQACVPQNKIVYSVHLPFS